VLVLRRRVVANADWIPVPPQDIGNLALDLLSVLFLRGHIAAGRGNTWCLNGREALLVPDARESVEDIQSVATVVVAHLSNCSVASTQR
jgi:hypothetical protein